MFLQILNFYESMRMMMAIIMMVCMHINMDSNADKAVNDAVELEKTSCEEKIESKKTLIIAEKALKDDKDDMDLLEKEINDQEQVEIDQNDEKMENGLSLYQKKDCVEENVIKDYQDSADVELSAIDQDNIDIGIEQALLTPKPETKQNKMAMVVYKPLQLLPCVVVDQVVDKWQEFAVKVELQDHTQQNTMTMVVYKPFKRLDFVVVDQMIEKVVKVELQEQKEPLPLIESSDDSLVGLNQVDPMLKPVETIFEQIQEIEEIREVVYMNEPVQFHLGSVTDSISKVVISKVEFEKTPSEIALSVNSIPTYQLNLVQSIHEPDNGRLTSDYLVEPQFIPDKQIIRPKISIQEQDSFKDQIAIPEPQSIPDIIPTTPATNCIALPFISIKNKAVKALGEFSEKRRIKKTRKQKAKEDLEYQELLQHQDLSEEWFELIRKTFDDCYSKEEVILMKKRIAEINNTPVYIKIAKKKKKQEKKDRADAKKAEIQEKKAKVQMNKDIMEMLNTIKANEARYAEECIPKELKCPKRRKLQKMIDEIFKQLPDHVQPHDRSISVNSMEIMFEHLHRIEDMDNIRREMIHLDLNVAIAKLKSFNKQTTIEQKKSMKAKALEKQTLKVSMNTPLVNKHIKSLKVVEMGDSKNIDIIDDM